MVPACVLAPWKSCRGGGLALAESWLACARHPPCPPTGTPVAALAEVRYLQRGFVLVLQPVSSACGWEPAAAAWADPAGMAQGFHLSVLEQLPGHMLCALYVRAGVSAQRSKSKEPRSEQRPAPMGANLSASPARASHISVPAPLLHRQSPTCRVRAKCPHCHRAHISAVVPSILGAIPPHAPQQSPFCRGQSRAGGTGWDVSP